MTGFSFHPFAPLGPLVEKVTTRYAEKATRTNDWSRLTPEALINLIAAWSVRNAETRRRVPRYLSQCVRELQRRIGAFPALTRCRVRAAQLVLTLYPNGRPAK